MNKSEDVIYRQAVLDTIEKFSCCGYIEEDVDKLFKAINELNPAQPERKRGKWEYISENSYTGGWRCSVCKKYALVVAVPLDHYGVHLDTKQELTDFCPHCGADLRGKKDE